MFIDFREREASMWDKNIDQLPPIGTLTGDRTHNHFVYGMMLQPLNHPAGATYYAFISLLHMLSAHPSLEFSILSCH